MPPLSDGRASLPDVVRNGVARGTCGTRAGYGAPGINPPPSRKGRRRVLREVLCFANTSYTTVRKNTTIFVFCEHFKPLPKAGTGRGKLGSSGAFRRTRHAVFMRYIDGTRSSTAPGRTSVPWSAQSSPCPTTRLTKQSPLYGLLLRTCAPGSKKPALRKRAPNTFAARKDFI